MKFIPLLSLVALITVLSNINAFSEEKYITRVTNWPPIYYQDATGHWTGLEVELIRAVFKRAGMTSKFVDQPWVRGLKNMETGETHFMLNVSKTPEREAYMYFVGPSRKTTGMGLIVKSENTHWAIENLDDLVTIAKKYDKHFGYQNGAFYSEAFNRRIKTDPEFKRHFEVISKIDSNIQKTLRSRILGFFELPLVMAYRIKNEPQYHGLAVHSFRFNRDNGEDVYFGVSKAGVSKEALAKFQAAFEKCESDGTLSRLVAEWEKKF